MDRAQVAGYAAHFQQQPPPPQQQPQSSPQQSPFSVANATLNLSQPTASHPSYAEMIASAITFGNSQGKEGGSSKTAIAKYIDQAYSDLPPTHSALLTHHLKRLTSSGQLVMIKNSYQFPYYSPTAATTTTTTTRSPLPQQQAISTLFGNDQTATPKRKPGRPAKVKQPEIESQLFGDGVPVDVDVASPKRKPGRPAKVLQPEIGTHFVSDAGLKEGVVNENGGSSGKRPRGRPPKEKSPHFLVQQQVDVPFVDSGVSNGQVEGNGSVRRSGRPPTKKNYAEQEEEEEDGQVEGDGSVRKRGRPSTKKKYVEEEEDATFVDSGVSNGQVEGDGSVRRSGRPLSKKKYVEEEEEPEAVAVADVPPGYEVKRKRGRPAKVNMGVGVEKVNNESGNVYVGKKRGRKPKGSVAVVTTKVGKRLYTGKARGRPKRKSTYAENTPGQGQQTTNEELLMMLEEMQSKLKDVVRVIKPYLDQCPPDALAALQLLEELSTMDANPSSPVTDPPTMTEPMDATPEPQ